MENSGSPDTSGIAQAISNAHYGVEAEPPQQAAEPTQPEPIVPEPVQPEETPPIPSSASSPDSVPAPALDYSQWLREQTDGKVDDPGRLKALLSDPIDLLQDHERQLLNIVRSGVEPMEYLQLQSTDFKAMDPMELERYNFLQDNKTMPKDLVDTAFEDYVNQKYPNLDSLMEGDNRARLDQYKLQQNAQAIADKFEQRKEELRLLPATQKASEGQPQHTPEQIAAQQKAVDAYLAQVDELLKTDQLTFEVKSGEEARQVAVKVSRSPDFKEGMINPDQFATKRWVNPDGTMNPAQIQRDQDLLENLPKIIQSIYEQGLSARESQVLNALENPAPNASIAAQSTEPSMDAVRAAVQRAHNGQGGQFASWQ